MAKLKTYTLGNNGFINDAVRSALGLPAHVRQASVLVTAASKTAAITILAERGFRSPSPRDPDFRQVSGGFVDELVAAGLLDEPAVIVSPAIAVSGDDVVVRVDRDGNPHRVGEHVGSGSRRHFVPSKEA